MSDFTFSVLSPDSSVFDSFVQKELGLEYAAKENLKTKVYQLRSDLTMYEKALTYCEDTEQLHALQKLYDDTETNIRHLKEILFHIDPDALTYLDGGKVDDCRDITNQSAVINNFNNGEAIVDQVVNAGPEYYPKTGAYAYDERQLKAAEANYEQSILRTKRYDEELKNEDGQYVFAEHVGMKNLHSNLEVIMRMLWYNIKEETKTKITYLPTEIEDLKRKLGPRYDFQTGELIRKEYIPESIIVPCLKLLKKKGHIHISKRDNVYYVEPILTRLAYDISRINIDEFNVVSEKPKYSPQMYRRGGTFYPRIAIMCQPGSNMPMFVSDKIIEEYTTPNYRIVRKRRYDPNTNEPTGEFDRFNQLIDTGFPFQGSRQLHPEKGRDYDKNGRYSFRSNWSELAKDIFLQQLATNNSSKINVITSAVRGNDGKYFHKRQAYMKFMLPKDAYPEIKPGKKKYVLIFCDIQTPWPLDGLQYINTVGQDAE